MSTTTVRTGPDGPTDAAKRPPTQEEVVVLDFGGQYSQLIARRVRECGVFSELLPHHVGLDEVRRRRPKGVILSGGPASVYEEGAPALRRELLELGVPVLGICYGMQLIARELDGRVERAEVGRVRSLGAHRGGAGPVAGGHAAPAELLDVPSRHGVRAAARIRRARVLDDLSGGRVRVGRARHLRNPVPSRSGPHAVRPAGPDELPRGRVRVRAHLEPEVGDRRADRSDPRPGRRRAGDLRALGRGRLERGGAPRPPRDRRPADVRVRRPRLHAQERKRSGGLDLP